MHNVVLVQQQPDALPPSDDAFKELVERCPAPIFVHRRGTFLYLNPAFLKWSGFSAEELIGRSLLETVIHPEEREVKRVQAKLGEVMMRLACFCRFRAFFSPRLLRIR